MRHRRARKRRTTLFRGQASCILDVEGHFLNVSPSLASFFHSDGSTLRGRSLFSCMESGEAAQVAPLIARVAAAESAESFQVRLTDSAGRPAWVQMHLQAGGTDHEGRSLIAAFFDNP